MWLDYLRIVIRLHTCVILWLDYIPVKYVQWKTGKMSYDPWQSMYSGKLGKCLMIPGKVCTVGNWENVLWSLAKYVKWQNWQNLLWSLAKYVKWQNGKMSYDPCKVCTVENWENVLWSLAKYVQWETGKMSYDP